MLQLFKENLFYINLSLRVIQYYVKQVARSGETQDPDTEQFQKSWESKILWRESDL